MNDPSYSNTCRRVVPMKRHFPALLLCAAFFLLSAEAADARQILAREKVETFLYQYVLDKGPWKPGDVEVKVASFKPLALSAGELQIRILRPQKGITPGAHTFFLAVDVAGQEEARVWVRAEIRLFGDVVVSSSPLAHREMIAGKDVRLARRDITSLSDKPFKRIEETVGKQATRAIEVNEVLTASSVDSPRLLRRGSAVTLVYENAKLRIETPGFAEEGGRAGDVIQVKNAASGKILRGVILDGRSVKVN